MFMLFVRGYAPFCQHEEGQFKFVAKNPAEALGTWHLLVGILYERLCSSPPAR